MIKYDFLYASCVPETQPLQARRVTSASIDAGMAAAARIVQGSIQGGSQNERVAGSRGTK